MPASATIARPGSIPSQTAPSPCFSRRVADARCGRRDGRGNVELLVAAVGIGRHAETTADYDPFALQSEACKPLRRCDESRRVLQIGRLVVDLRTDMGVDAGEAQVRIGQKQRRRRGFVTRVNAELAVFSAGAHECMCAGIDADV